MKIKMKDIKDKRYDIGDCDAGVERRASLGLDSLGGSVPTLSNPTRADATRGDAMNDMPSEDQALISDAPGYPLTI